MEESLFLEYIQKWFPGIVTNVVETLNDTKNPRPFYHKRMLTKQYSVTGKWESVSSANTRVAADVVAMDSALPLKKRDSLSKASGDLPKMGMKMWLNEKQLTELDVLGNQLGGSNAEAVQKQMLRIIFGDTPRVIEGIDERLEMMFLEGLSTGITSVVDSENVGTEIRLDFGYLTENKFGVDTLWSNPASTPFTDIQRVIDAAEAAGNTITTVKLDQATFNNIAATDQAKSLFAWSMGMPNATTVPTPSIDQVNGYSVSNFGLSFEIIKRTVKVEKNGIRTNVTPWDTGKVILLGDDNVGSLMYSFLAEMNHPVQNVQYATANDYTLVSKYRKNEPSLSEYTSSQARVVPVITNVDSIYQIDSLTVNA